MTKIAEFTIDKIGDYKDFYKINPGYHLEGYPIHGWDYIIKRKESYFIDSKTILNMLYISDIWYDPVKQEPKEVKNADIPDVILDQRKLGEIMDNDNWFYEIHRDREEDMAEAVVDFVPKITVDIKNVGIVPYSVVIYNFPMPIIKRNFNQIDFKVKTTVARDIYIFLGMLKPHGETMVVNMSL